MPGQAGQDFGGLVLGYSDAVFCDQLVLFIFFLAFFEIYESLFISLHFISDLYVRFFNICCTVFCKIQRTFANFRGRQQISQIFSKFSSISFGISQNFYDFMIVMLRLHYSIDFRENLKKICRKRAGRQQNGIDPPQTQRDLSNHV